MWVEFREIPDMNQAPRRQEYPPLEGMYVFSPASALSFSDGVNQRCFWWSGDSFQQMSLWLHFFCLLIRILFANWCCLECASQKGHSNAPTCILLLPCEVFYHPEEKSLCWSFTSVLLKSCFHASDYLCCQMIFPAVNMRQAYTGTQGQASTP